MPINMVPWREDYNTHISSSLVNSCGQKKPNRVPKEETESDQCDFIFPSKITDDLLIEILIRLPNDYACRYKTVCKRWYSLMSSRYFVSRYINHAPSPAPNTFTLVFRYLVLHGTEPGAILRYSYPIGAISNHPVLSKHYRNRCLNINQFLYRFKEVNPRSRSKPICVMASCHDLLLCYYDVSSYVVNVLTRQWIELPPLPLREQDCRPTLLNIYGTYKAGLLCYHDQNDVSLYEFKVILIPAVRSGLVRGTIPEINASQYSIRIFCSKLKQWTDLVVDWYPLKLSGYQEFTPILSHNGMLHWLNGQSLVSLDHQLKLNHSVDLPNGLSLETLLGFGVCQGRFRVAHRTNEEATGRPILLVWELEDYHKGAWQLAHRMQLRQSSLSGYSFKLIAFHPYNKDIIFVELKKLVCQFNMQTRRHEMYYELKVDINSETNRTVEAIIPPILHQWFPTPVPSPVQD